MLWCRHLPKQQEHNGTGRVSPIFHLLGYRRNSLVLLGPTQSESKYSRYRLQQRFRIKFSTFGFCGFLSMFVSENPTFSVAKIWLWGTALY